MGSWANDMNNKIKHISANAGYYDLPRQAIYATYLDVCTIALKPYKFGMINTKISLKILKSNGEHEIIEVPIVGYVSPDTNPLRHHKLVGEKRNLYYPADPNADTSFVPKEIVFDSDAVPYAMTITPHVFTN